MLKHSLLPLCLIVMATAPALAAVERDFDKIRHFRAYDPATDKWSAIEDFETVEILESRTEQRPENYVYRSFWAYDPQTERWYKVDILDHGYKLTAASATPNQEETAPPKKPYRFWKNVGLALRVGGGATFYQNNVNNLQLEQRHERFYLQTADEAKQEKNQVGHLIRWFGAVYVPEQSFETGKSSNRKLVLPGEDISFTGQGWNLPATLVMHFTFFERLRLGGGGTFEVNYLKELAPKGAAAGKVDTYTVDEQDRWFYNITWLGLAAFKVIKRPHYAVLLDFQVGSNYNQGLDPVAVFSVNRYVNTGMLYSLGLAYERKLNGYFKFLSRLSGDLKLYQDGPPLFDAQGDDSAFVFYRQIAIHLEAGISLNFGKDDDDEKEKAKSSGRRGRSIDGLRRGVRDAKGKRDRLKGLKGRMKRGVF